MRTAPWVLLLVACSDLGLRSAAGALAVEPKIVAFDPAWVGYPATRSIRLSNDGRSPIEVALAIPYGPFRISADSVVVPPGTLTAEVELSAEAAGMATGELIGTYEGGELRIPLSATVQTPPDCHSSSCAAAVFDPSTGTCRASALADGTPCSDACLVSARCFAGECVGAQRSCDDGNRCTADACDPVKGCVHTDATSGCPQPAKESCLVATCDPASRCGTAPAADYAPCGDVSCALANVCLGGVCTKFTPPDGFPCGPASPCGVSAKCQAQRCVSREAPLSERWRYTPPTFAYVDFRGVADDDGNLYFVECDGCEVCTRRCHSYSATSCADCDRLCQAGPPHGPCELVSLSPSGGVRFRSPVPTAVPISEGWGSVITVAGGRVFVPARAGRVHAFSTFDGRALWSSPESLTLRSNSSGWTPSADYLAMQAIPDGRGRVHFGVVESDSGDRGVYMALHAVDEASGALLGSFDSTFGYGLLAVPGRAGLFVKTWGRFFDETVYFDAVGAQWWREGIGAVLPNTGEALITSSEDDLSNRCWAFSAAYREDGTALWSRNDRVKYAVASESTVFATIEWIPEGTCLPAHALAALDARTGKAVWTVPMNGWYQLMLTRGDDLLAETNNLKLVGVRKEDGRQQWSCSLPAAGAGALVKDTYVVAVKSASDAAPAAIVGLAVPGYELAKTGWVLSGGNPGRTWTARK